jgi:XRE family transcriptional regulator, fatty acid utilization regulator
VERGLQQSEVARRLGVSPAYLSLIEKGKRQLQLPLLFKALDLYGVGMEDFMSSLGERHVDHGLQRLLDEPLLRSLNLSEEDLASPSAEPKMVTTVTALFNLYKTTRSQLDNVLLGLSQRERGEAEEGRLRFDYSPFDEVIDFLEQNGNWFAALEDRADAFRKQHTLGTRPGREGLVRALRDALGVEVKILPPEEEGSVVRRWDPPRGVLVLSQEMLEQRIKFQLAHTVGLRLLDEEHLHDAITAGHAVRHAETRKLIKIHLANYFAGALLLPYDDFFREVSRTRYDVELVANLFESTYETVAHRVCNLGDPRRRGIPMHFLRVDVAGNISKRYSSTGIRFPYGLGSCAKWAVHQSFLTPSTITKQYSIFPDGSSYFCFAKVVSESRRGSVVRGTTYSIGLGCHASDAKHLAYADEMPFVDPKRMAIPVGSTCRFCERTDCNQRSAPSYKFAFHVDEYTKKDNFFSPLVQLREKEKDG